MKILDLTHLHIESFEYLRYIIRKKKTLVRSSHNIEVETVTKGCTWAELGGLVDHGALLTRAMNTWSRDAPI